MMFPIKNILHPNDFSTSGDEAFEMAGALAKQWQAELTVLHVVTESAIPPRPGVLSHRPTEGYKEERRQTLERMQAAHPEITIQYALEEGDPKEVILEYAEKTQPDLIVMGTHGRTGIAHFLMGSVAEHVLRNAACPVLTLRSGTIKS